MPSFPLLFDLGKQKPTTRDIANTVKAGGRDALTDAERRADAARYQEVTCRSALNRVKGMPFEWTLNPYRGCTHGCHYCFARRYHVQFEMNADDDFASVILVKHNVAAVLATEIDRPAWARELVAFGTATDPYQPIEGHYKLTRQCIQVLARGRTPMSIVTHPLQRLRAVRALVDAGINAGVLMAPIVPGFTSSRSKLERTIKTIADHGARFVGCNVMYLQDGTRVHFMKFLEREFPSMVPRFERLYVKKYPPEAYRKEVQGLVRALQERYGLTKRGEANPEEVAEEQSEAEQVGFAW